MQNNNNNPPLKFPKKPPLYVFLEHLHGVDAQGEGSVKVPYFCDIFWC